MNIHELISSINADLESAKKREQNARAEVNLIIRQAKAEHRRDLTEAEDIRCDGLLATIESAVADRKQIEGKLARAEAARAEDEHADKLSRESHLTPAGRRMTAAAGTAVLSIGRSERTYDPDKDHAAGGKPGSAFLLDVGKAYLGDPIAQERLQRHQLRS